jgi:hypothetical protein
MSMSEARLWNEVLEPYRQGDWHECLRRLRAQTEAEPFALLPQLLLAETYVRLNQHQLAVLQYDRLMPLAVAKGDLFAAIAAQKHTVRLRPRDAADRFYSLQRWFRMVGVPRAPSRNGTVTAATLLTLPPEWFLRAVEEAELEWFQSEARRTAQGGTQWAVVRGQARWRFTGAVLAAPEDRSAQAGEVVVCPGCSEDSLELHVVPETPTQCLRFDAELLRQWEPMLIAASASSRDLGVRRGWPGIERRTAPRATPPSSVPEAPPRLAPGTPARPDPGVDMPEMEVLPLPEVASSADLDTGANDATLEFRWPGSRTPVVLEGGYVIPDTWDPFAPRTPHDPASERRQSGRARIALEGGVVHLGVEVTHTIGVRGVLADLSETGVGICFRLHDAREALPVLRDAVVRLELRVPPRREPLKVSGCVRWLQLAEPQDQARVGIEFHDLSEEDRAGIQAALNAARARADSPPAKSLDAEDPAA